MANKFISILESIGQKFVLGVKKAVAIETKLLPIEQEIATGLSLVPSTSAVGVTLLDLLGIVGKVQQISTAVGATTGSGEQKLIAAVPDVEQAILGDPIFKGKKIPDLTVYNAALAKFTGGFVDLLHSFESDTPPVVIIPPAPDPKPAVQTLHATSL